MSEWDVVDQSDATPQSDPPDQADDTLTTGSTQDDWSVASQEPIQARSQEPQPQGQDPWGVVSQEPWDVASQEPSGGEWSQAGSFAAGAAKGAAPAGAGLAAGIAAGAAATPFTSPVGGLVVGLGVGLGAGWLTSIAQDQLLALTGLDKPLHAAEKAHKTAFTAGEFAPAAAFLRPNARSLDIGARAVGGLIGGGAEAGMEALGGGEWDPQRIAMAAGTGVAFPRLNKLGERFATAGANAGARYRGGNKPNQGGQNPEPGLDPAEPPAPQEPDIVVANDDTTVAAGVAAENKPAPDVDAVGNPGAGAGSKHKAEGPERYAKDDVTRVETGLETPSEAVVQRPDVPTDVAAAFKTDVAPLEPQASVPARPDVRPPQEPAATKPPVPEEVVPRGEADFGDAAIDAARARGEQPDAPVETGLAEQAPKAPPEPAPIDNTPLKPQELQTLNQIKKQLVERGDMNQFMERLNALPPREQLNAILKADQALSSKSGEAIGRTEERLRPEAARPTISSGAMARSKADAARKEGAIKLWSGMFDEFGPNSEKGQAIGDPLDAKTRAATRDYAKQAWAEAIHRNGGKDPLTRENYLPAKKGHGNEDQLQWLRAVKALAVKGDFKRFASLHVKSEKGKGMGEMDAETGRTEAEIMRRPQLEEAAEQAETSQQPGEFQRPTFEHMERDPRPGADHTYVDEHNKLADWLNDLSPTQYEKLNEKYELRAEMDEPADPASLMSEMKQTLADTGKRPGVIEAVPAEDAPAISERVDVPQIKNTGRFDDTPLEEGKVGASKGRTLDKNSDEFKRLAAQYAEKGPAKPRMSAEERLAAEKEAQTRTEERPIDETSEAATFDKLKAFAKDESGAGGAKLVQALMARFTKTAAPPPNTPSTGAGKAANANGLDYANSVREDMRVSDADTVHFIDDLRKLYDNAKAAQKADPLTPYEWRKLDLAIQKDDVKSLPAKSQKMFNDFIKPALDQYKKDYVEVRDLNDKYGLKMELPDPAVRGIDVQHFPRHKEDTVLWNRKEDDIFDPFSNRSLAGFAETLQPRSFKVLRDVGADPNSSSMTGNRMVVELTGDAKSGFEASILRKGVPAVKLKNLPPSFTGEVGDLVPLTVKGKTSRWQVDHAATDEIETATGGKVKYMENPMINTVMAARHTKMALEAIKLRTKIMDSQDFKDLTTKSKKEAEERGYDPRPTRLKEFSDLYMPKNLKWVFDDYAKPGFGGDAGLDKLRAFNMGVAKFININAPLVHVWNEGVQVLVARGHRNFWPPSYYRAARLLPEAVRDVNSQGAIQREMRNNGAHPQLASTLARGMDMEFARLVGMDMTKNASTWDPIAKMYNMTTEQAYNKLYKGSSDVTWRLSEYMSTLHYLELKAEGYSGKEAADKLNKYFSTYQVPTTIFGSRTLQQVLTDPATTLFGRYKANILQSFKYMGQDMVKGTPAEKAEAFGQMLTLGALGLFGYSLINKGLEKLTGIEGIELRPRGMSALPGALIDVAQGKKSMGAAAVHMWTPAPALRGSMEFAVNKDFRGKEIFPQGDWSEDPMTPVEGAGRLAEHALRSFVPPYSQVSHGYSRDEDGGALGAAKGFLWEQVGVTEPSERSLRYQDQVEKFNARNRKARAKRPDGVIPDIIERFRD